MHQARAKVRFFMGIWPVAGIMVSGSLGNLAHPALGRLEPVFWPYRVPLEPIDIKCERLFQKGPAIVHFGVDKKLPSFYHIGKKCPFTLENCL